MRFLLQFTDDPMVHRLPRVRTFLAAVSLILLVAPATRAQEKPFELHGTYLEGCTCGIACSCDLLGGMVSGCHVMGAMLISSGSYGGADLSGTKIAFAVTREWARIYIQAADAARAKTAGALARAMMSGYAPVESLRDAKIDLSGSSGNYTLQVDGGKVIDLKTQPLLGADGKTAVTYTNYPDPMFHTIMQGKTVSGRFQDGDRQFKLEGTNSLFNADWSASGKA